MKHTVAWAIQTPTGNFWQRTGKTKLDVWRINTSHCATTLELKEIIKRRRSEGFRTVKVRLVEEPGVAEPRKREDAEYAKLGKAQGTWKEALWALNHGGMVARKSDPYHYIRKISGYLVTGFLYKWEERGLSQDEISGLVKATDWKLVLVKYGYRKDRET